MKRLGFALLLLNTLLFSCSSPEDEVIDMNEIIPQSENYKEGEGKPSDDLMKNDFGFNQQLAILQGIDVMEVDSFPEPMFPDRFLPKSIQKLTLHFKEDAVFFGQWTFKDSMKTMNALFNWMDCFGPKCKSLKYLESASFQSDALLLFVNDTSLTYISASIPLDEKKWQLYLKESHGIALWDLVIVQKKQRKANWYRFDVNESSKDTTFIKLN
jgi:hypothetical protein